MILFAKHAWKEHPKPIPFGVLMVSKTCWSVFVSVFTGEKIKNKFLQK